jgi:putative heme-binding domain-containing protein
VQKWTIDALAALHTSDGPQGDAERGRLLFRDALCSRCHRVGIRGAAVGPDLTFVGRRFSRRDMLESVLSPNLSVAEQYRQEAIETHSGQTHIGRIIPEGDYRKETLKLALDPLDASKVIVIDKKEIAEHKSVPTSPMPSGLLDTFTIEEIRDLLAFLESGGK